MKGKVRREGKEDKRKERMRRGGKDEKTKQVLEEIARVRSERKG